MKIKKPFFVPTQKFWRIKDVKATERRESCLLTEDVEACCSEVREVICRMRHENDTHGYTLTQLTVYMQCLHTFRQSSHTVPPTGPHIQQNQVLSCFVASIYSAGCVRTTPGGEWRAWVGETWAAGVHVGVGRLILFAFGTQTVQSMQIDKQWLLLCSFSLWYCSLSASKQKRWCCVCICVCGCSAHTPARCIHLFKSPPAGHAHAPQITWKAHPQCELLSQRQLWCLKMETGVFERKAYRCISARGGEEQLHVWCWVLSWLLTAGHNSHMYNLET